MLKPENRAGRLAAGFALRATGKAFYICDSTVPRQRVPEMMARSRQIAASHGLDVPILGHAGDGNLHPVVLYEPGSWPPSRKPQQKLPTRRWNSVAR